MAFTIAIPATGRNFACRFAAPACALACVSSACAAPTGQETPQHFVFFGLERDRIKEASFLESPAFQGAQLKYTWKELEPEKDKYDTGLVVRDLEFLQSNGKKLFIQLQDISFSTARDSWPTATR